MQLALDLVLQYRWNATSYQILNPGIAPATRGCAPSDGTTTTPRFKRELQRCLQEWLRTLYATAAAFTGENPMITLLRAAIRRKE